MRSCKLFDGGRQSLAVACLFAIHAAIALAAEVEPYEARIAVARAQVRSGPGDNYYPTETLAQGETVEVYQEQGLGWLAIRPPQGSFSWVFGRHVRVRDDGLAEIEKENIASRIGSRFSNKRNAVQVRLREGEVVEVLGKEQTSGETWYKIAPPAGEFRWIRAAEVRRIRPLALSEDDPTTEPLVVATSATNDNTTATADENDPSADEAETSVEETKAPADDWRAAPVAGTPTSSSIAPPPLASSGGVRPSAVTPIASEPPVAPAPTSKVPAGQVPDAPMRQLTDIELRLSRMVAAPPDLWNTERLERDTQALLARAQTSEEREAAKAMLAKLDRFAAIGRRHQQLPDVAAPGQPVVTPPTDSAASEDAGRYDAVGILRPVVSKRPGAPQFALVDDRGLVISFVTPTPDVNLQPYLGHRVGVVGTRGFIQEFQRAHVTAGRITPLSGRFIR